MSAKSFLHAETFKQPVSLSVVSEPITHVSEATFDDPGVNARILVQLADELFTGEDECPYYCMQYLHPLMRDSVAGVPTTLISSGPEYQVQIIRSGASEAVRKRAAQGMVSAHARALCWEALVLSLLFALQPKIIPALRQVVCTGAADVQILQQRCCSLQQFTLQHAPHPRLAALSPSPQPQAPVPFSDAISLIFQIAVAVCAAHSLSSVRSGSALSSPTTMAIVHGNLQPDNVLLRLNDNMPVLCGWSHSMVHWRDEHGMRHVFSAAEVPDDPVYNAPELQAAEDSESALRALSDRTDVWGFALVSLFLLTGKTPYHGMRLRQVTRAREKHMPPYEPSSLAATSDSELQGDVGRQVLQLLKHCLAVDPEERPSMRQCVHALGPLATGFLKQNARQLHETAHETIQRLEGEIASLKNTLQQERGERAALMDSHAASLPTHVPEHFEVSLQALCDDTEEKGRPPSHVLNLGSRPITSATGHDAPPEGIYTLPCGVAGGVFRLRDGDKVRVMGVQCRDIQCTRTHADAAPERAQEPPRLVFGGEGAEVRRVESTGCTLHFSTACTVVEGCRVACDGTAVGFEVTEAAGDPTIIRQTVLRDCTALQCRVGLLVKAVPSEVQVQDSKFQGSAEHNIWLRKVATRACSVVLKDVESSGATRSGALVETLCSVEAIHCNLSHNAHYGVQVLPKGVARLERCNLDFNRRGGTSGNGVYYIER